MTTDTSTATATKSCCACGISVSGQARMKDSQGKYWCIACGQADQRRKQMSSTTAMCASCRKPFPKGKLDKDGEWFFCKPCMKKRTKATARASAKADDAGGAASAASESPDSRKTVMLVAVGVVLVIVSLLINFVILA